MIARVRHAGERREGWLSAGWSPRIDIHLPSVLAEKHESRPVGRGQEDPGPPGGADLLERHAVNLDGEVYFLGRHVALGGLERGARPQIRVHAAADFEDAGVLPDCEGAGARLKPDH